MLIELLLTHGKLLSTCCIIRHWIPILGVDRLLRRPSVDPCVVFSVCGVIYQGGSSVFLRLENFSSEKYYIISHAAQIMYKICNSLINAASSVSGSLHVVCSICTVIPLCAPSATSSITVHHQPFNKITYQYSLSSYNFTALY